MRMGYETRSTTVDWISAGVWMVLALGLLALFIVITPNSFNAEPAVTTEAEAHYAMIESLDS
jgi:hypothetical protein